MQVFTILGIIALQLLIMYLGEKYIIIPLRKKSLSYAMEASADMLKTLNERIKEHREVEESMRILATSVVNESHSVQDAIAAYFATNKMNYEEARQKASQRRIINSVTPHESDHGAN